MFSAFSSAARRDITVNIVVPTSGNLLVNRNSALQSLQSAGERMYGEPAFAQDLRRGQTALTGGANQQCSTAAAEQARIGKQFVHRDMPRSSGVLGHFLGGSNIDDLEAALRGGGQ